MKHLKKTAAVLTATALAVLLGVNSASATILEVGGATKDESVGLTATLESGTGAVLKNTFNESLVSCATAEVDGDTDSPYTGTSVTGALDTLWFGFCNQEVKVHKPGTLHIQHIAGTTNGTVSSSGAEVTTGSPFGILNCKTETGTHLGTLTGVKSGHATLHVKANLSCSGVSSVWEATYTVTGPTGLGVLDKAPPTTTLEVGGTPKAEALEIAASLKSGTSAILKDTFGFTSNTCTGSEAKGDTDSPFGGTTVTGALDSLSFSSCQRPVTVHKAGTLHIQHIAGTTNGTVESSGASVTTGSPFGTLNCETGAGKHLGTLKGIASGHATIDILAKLSCSGISSVWEASYTITSPTGLGVSEQSPPPSATTTLEVGGATKTEAINLEASLKSGSSATLRDTFGFSINTCTGSEAKGDTDSPYTGTSVTGALDTLSFSSCARSITVHKAGTLHIVHIAGTTNGTVTSSGAEVTTDSPFGTINCRSSKGTHLGTLTGVSSGHATMDVNAVLSCGGISSPWQATYTVTGPTGLGVSA